MGVPVVVPTWLVSVYFLCRNQILWSGKSLCRVQNLKFLRVHVLSHLSTFEPAFPGFDFRVTLAEFGKSTPFFGSFPAVHGVFSFFLHN